MLNRYQTGPIITLLVIATGLVLCGLGIVDALRYHHREGWLSALSFLLLLFAFHKHFHDHKTS